MNLLDSSIQKIRHFLFLAGRALLWFFMTMAFLVWVQVEFKGGYNWNAGVFMGLILESIFGACVAYLAYKEVKGKK